MIIDCILLGVNCLVCPDSAISHRIDNSKIDNTCPCKDTYFDNTVAVCAKCNYTCDSNKNKLK
jgi:hypothetical protein